MTWLEFSTSGAAAVNQNREHPAFPLGIRLYGNNRVRRPRFPDRCGGLFAAFGPEISLDKPMLAAAGQFRPVAARPALGRA